MKKRNLVPMIVLASSLALMACSGGEDTSKEAGQEQEANHEEEAEEGEGKEDQEKTGVRIMGKITLKLPGEKDFFTQEAFKVLRTNLQFCGQDVQVISITSCDENEGKTTVSLQLARSLAELGKNVLIIDADMRKSVMAGRNTDAKDIVGLSEVLTGMVKLKDAIYSTQYPTLQLIFAGKYPPNPVELLIGKYFVIVKNSRA